MFLAVQSIGFDQRLILPTTWYSVLNMFITDSFTKHYDIQNEPVHEISNNVVCATSKASDQPAHMRSLITAFASRLSII